jgi:hypothetical protein
MRRFIGTFSVSLLLFGGVFSFSQLIANSRNLFQSTQMLHAYALRRSGEVSVNAENVFSTTRQRALLYEAEIGRSHLVDGMVVNRGSTGEMLDQCDSLLFSAIRYVSLDKLEWHDKAADAWRAIEGSRDNGAWLRHPRCYRSISRDMLLGLLLAMTRRPDGYEQHLNHLMNEIDQNGGFFGTGPVYVSYLSPGLARLMAAIAKQGRATSKTIPESVSTGYSTAELEVMITPAGYTSHLGGLTAWLEMELISQGRIIDDSGPTILGAADKLVAAFVPFAMESQRLDWITDRLTKADPTNLFFRYLRLRSANALSLPIRLDLLKELLSMKQFPTDRLPMNCDRKSDYLWQRDDKSVNYDPIPCQVEYAGVDFLWMAALLLEDPEAIK